MAIRITEDGTVVYENEPDVNRELFPNLPEGYASKEITVSGSTPVILAEPDTQYVCGEVTSLTFTPSTSGICDVRFTSGTTATTLTLPSTVKMPDGFDLTNLEANTVYEINVVDGVYGTVMSWSI